MSADNAAIAKELKVGIVGGSIAGCVAAVELHRAGCEVTLFERSHGDLQDRGAGIASSFAHLDLLKARDLIDADYPFVPFHANMWTRPAAADPKGHIIWKSPGAASGMNWGVLFANHHKRVPEAIHLHGANVIGVDEGEDGKVTLRLEDGRQFVFDLVVFADGYNSLGRRYLFPDAKMEYAGYVIWRGLIDEAQAPVGMFGEASEWAVHQGGLCIFYKIPGQHGELQPGRRLQNWAWYRLTPAEQLPELLTDKRGRMHDTSLPRGAATEQHKAYIRARAREDLRGEAADVICATEEPFIQVIYDLHVPAYAARHICLVGDASSLARPHTGAGAIKAQTQAIALSNALTGHTSLDAALQAWNEEVWAAGDKQVTLGKVLGQALVTGAPNWDMMDEARMEKWWKDATSGVYVYYFDDAKEKKE